MILEDPKYLNWDSVEYVSFQMIPVEPKYYNHLNDSGVYGGDEFYKYLERHYLPHVIREIFFLGIGDAFILNNGARIKKTFHDDWYQRKTKLETDRDVSFLDYDHF